MTTRAAGKRATQLAKQAANVKNDDPPTSSPVMLVLLTRHYFLLDKSIYSNNRMTKIRNRWMKAQMLTPDDQGGLTCAICGRKGLQPFTKDKNKLATLDHIHDIRFGGKWNDPTNFQVACSHCNNNKSSGGNDI